jgi:preprotein translocase subunit SecG
MYYILLAVYVIVCIFLIATILLQAGRGGGLTEAFGGSAESVLGTQAPVVLKRATEIGAALFIVLALVLAMMTARKGRSLFDQMRMPMGAPSGTTATVPGMPSDEAQTAPEAPVQEDSPAEPDMPATDQPASE